MKESIPGKETGLCPHGNFPNRCDSCRAESERHLQSDLSAYIESFQARIEEVSKNREMSAEQREVEKQALEMFINSFAKPTAEVLQQQIETESGSTTLDEILQKFLQGFERTGESTETSVIQENMLRELVALMKDMPVGTWDTSIAQTSKTKKNNCSGSAALLTTILESTAERTGIIPDYVNPYGHALVIARLSDGRIMYADGRNGVLEDITDDVDFEERDDFNIYGLRRQKPEMPFRYLPTTKENWRLIVENYAGNMEELPDAAEGVFDDVLQNTATPDELAKIQSEAAAALSETGITRNDTETLRKVKNHLEGGLHDFRNSPDFGGESELWKQIHAGQEHLQAARERASSIEGLIDSIKSRKGELRAFLLGEKDTFASGDAQVDEDLHKYRDARKSARIMLHKTDEEFVEEVDALLSEF